MTKASRRSDDKLARKPEQDRRRGVKRANSESLAKTLAPEQIRVGDYVGVLRQISELPSFFWPADGSAPDREMPVRITQVPRSGGIVLRVLGVCLPYVLTKSARGKVRTLDVRLVTLARLDRHYARLAWKAYRA